MFYASKKVVPESLHILIVHRFVKPIFLNLSSTQVSACLAKQTEFEENFLSSWGCMLKFSTELEEGRLGTGSQNGQKSPKNLWVSVNSK